MQSLSVTGNAAAQGRHAEIEGSEGLVSNEGMCGFEAAVDAVVTEVYRLDRNRNVLYAILQYCLNPRLSEEVESFIGELPAMRHALQEPYVYMDALVDAGGLSATPLNEQGDPTDMQVYDAASDADRASMIVDYRIQTTPAGRRAVELLSPEKRMRAKLGHKPERYSTYVAVLDFCRQPRSLVDVKRLFEEDSTLNRETNVDSQPLSCDFYLSELERAGGLVWDGGWLCTAEGAAFLDAQEVDR